MAAKGVAATLDGLRSRPELNHLRVCILGKAQPSGREHALSGSGDKTVKLFNVNNGAVLRTFKHHTGPVNCLALLPDGLRFVSGSSDKTARIAYHGLAP